MLPPMNVTVRRWDGYTDGDIIGEFKRATNEILERAVVCPYTDMGQGQLRESMEKSGQFVPGTVKVTVSDDGDVLLSEGVLKGVIHNVSLDVDVVF